MTVKIPVSADAGGASGEFDKLSQSLTGVARSAKEIEDQAKRASTALGQVVLQAGKAGEATKKLEREHQRQARDPGARRGLADVDRRVESIARNSERLARLQSVLGRMYGRQFGRDDALSVVRGFEMNRRVSPRLREFSDIVDFFDNTGRAFGSDRAAQRRAEQYRRQVLNRSAIAGGVVLPGGMGGDGGEAAGSAAAAGGGGGGFQSAVSRGAARARAFAGGMLAIAGITSVMAMAGRGASMATEEAVGADTLKRTLGDVGVEFDKLRDELRAAGEGLGIASVEAVRLAQQFANVANANERADVAGNVRTAGGFARAHGIDPNAAVTFFAQMRHMGVTRPDDPGSRRLALMIADAVQRGGVTAKTDELLTAVANFTTQATRLTVTAPNVEGYLGAMASMTRSGRPGMDPGLAASIIGQADAAMRRGGAMGEASLNFTYAALARHDPTLSPLQAKTLWEQGLFGSARSAFGAGSAARSYADETGDFSVLPRGDRSSGLTNFEKARQQFERSGYRGDMLIDAVQNHFGLQSRAQAMELLKMRSEDIGRSNALMRDIGMDPNQASASSALQVARIANAGGGALRGDILDSLLGRSDVSETQKESLRSLAAGDDTEELRRAMARIASGLGYEETDGSAIRASLTDLNNTLTRLGEPMLGAITAIRDGVVSIVDTVVPKSEAGARFALERDAPEYARRKAAMIENQARIYEGRKEFFDQQLEAITSPEARALWKERKVDPALEELRRTQEAQLRRLIEENQDKEAWLRESGGGLPLSAIDPQAPLGSPAAPLQQFSFYHQIQQVDRYGQPTADPIITTHVSSPRAAGVA